MINILQVRLQQYMNREHPDVQAGFRKGRGTRDQIVNIRWIIEISKRIPEKTSTSASLISLKPLTVWATTDCGKLLEMGILDHLTCLLRNLYAGQEATVRTGHGTTECFQIRKGVCQGYIFLPYLFDLNATYIMQNTRLDEAQAGIKTAGRNINNLKDGR